jgi:hypothetical protein
MMAVPPAVENDRPAVIAAQPRSREAETLKRCRLSVKYLRNGVGLAKLEHESTIGHFTRGEWQEIAGAALGETRRRRTIHLIQANFIDEGRQEVEPPLARRRIDDDADPDRVVGVAGGHDPIGLRPETVRRSDDIADGERAPGILEPSEIAQPGAIGPRRGKARRRQYQG